MMRIILFVTLLLLASCINRCASSQGAHINDTAGNQESENSLSVIYSDVVRDSLSRFIESVKENPKTKGDTIYTIDFTLYKRDTLISFWAFRSVIYESFPFHDARVILKMIDNGNIIVTYGSDLMRLYTLVGDTTGEFSAYGAKKISDDFILAYTAHNLTELENFISAKDFDEITFKTHEIYTYEDSGPVVKIYKYQQDKGLELIGQQDSRSMPYRK